MTASEQPSLFPEISTKFTSDRFKVARPYTSEPERAIKTAIIHKAVEMEALFNQVKQGRYRSLAFTELEAAILWIMREIDG